MSGLYRINEEMENELTKVIKDITGSDTVMWTMQDAFIADDASVKPDVKDFIVLSFVAGPTPDDAGIQYTPSTTGTGLFDVSMRFKFTLSINLYTNNAHLFKILKIAQLIGVESYRNRLKSVGLSYFGAGAASDFSEFDETRYNLRSHIDLLFSYISVEKDVNIGAIEHFEATGTLGDNPSGVNVHKNKGIL